MIQSQMVTPPLAAIDGNDVEVEDRDHEEQDEVAASEGADQVGSGLGCGGQSLSAGCKHQVPHRAVARFGMTNVLLHRAFA